jgi:hypothetical protein
MGVSGRTDSPPPWPGSPGVASTRPEHSSNGAAEQTVDTEAENSTVYQGKTYHFCANCRVDCLRHSHAHFGVIVIVGGSVCILKCPVLWHLQASLGTRGAD